ncbi:MAG: 6-phospho-beta-glucosidase, partial [Acidobacteria bacterium]|nr:6-phospho-beta-glucosidase [Acidobacteriota bacterium]
MKISIIGGAGVRTPLLLRGLTHSDLPVSELALFDTDTERLRTISSLAGRVCGEVPLKTCRSSAECIEGAEFVIMSIRVGGIEQ